MAITSVYKLLLSGALTMVTLLSCAQKQKSTTMADNTLSEGILSDTADFGE